jgi:hypothetical protein
MMLSGIAYRLPPLAPLIDETESGYWPTPDVRGFTNDGSLEMLRKKVPNRDEWSAMAFRKGSGAKQRLWPTPNASKAANDVTLTKSGDGRTKPNKLGWAVALWPTPVSDDTGWRRNKYPQGGTALSTAIGGCLNPTWVEWLMGYPAGWTDLGASETP